MGAPRVSISSTSEEVQRLEEERLSLGGIRQFPLVQLPKKFKVCDQSKRTTGFRQVSISSTSEEVQRSFA